ncbi:MAG TPA: filamentous hemagglutinin family protein [Steroidobacteraceae bacterium]|nr:filamentous hemagglutinin family protein [Steroidobacteraceae bacterium]
MTTTSGKQTPVLQSLTLDARGLGGYGSQDTILTAGSINLTNVGDAQDSAPYANTPGGSGHLRLDALAGGNAATVPGGSVAGQIALGAGAKDIQGFGGGVALSAAGDIRLQDTGSLALAHDGQLTLAAARLSADSGAVQQISSDGVVQLTGGAAGAISVSRLPSAGLGGSLSITGTGLTIQGALVALPAGALSLQATSGDLTIGAGSQVNAAGVAIPYFDTYATAPGGQVALSAANGNVTVAQQASIDVSGATSPDGSVSGAAGGISVSAPHGVFDLAGTLEGSAASGQQQGSFSLDVASISAVAGRPAGDLTGLNHALSAGGFTGQIDIRDRTDGLVSIDALDSFSGKGLVVRAGSYQLAADQGSILVAGTIDTSGGTTRNPSGGDISIWAQGNVTLASGAVLNSSAGKPTGDAPATGGNVLISSAAGTVDVQAATIQMLGRASPNTNINADVSPDGQLTLRAPRTTGNRVQISGINAFIQGGKPIVVEGVRTYTGVSSIDASTDFGGGNLGFGSGGQVYADTVAFGQNAVSVAQSLADANSPHQSVEVRAGIEVQGSGDLAVNSTLDLNSLQAAAGVPVNLTVRAPGNLTFNGSLSDGFVDPQDGSAVTRWVFTGGSSATYRLAAGADLSGANALAVNPAAGNFELTAGNLIRTGTGDIAIAAGGNIRLDSQTSVIYTAGAPAALPADFTVPEFETGSYSTPAYGVGGGDIALRALGDVIGAPTNQLASNWLWRQGSVNGTSGQTTIGQNTSWWIEFSEFQQGVGALGGGNIDIQAGGNITNVSAVIPTTGVLAGTAGSAADAADLFVGGGGNLSVRAGRNVLSGIYQDDLGTAAISAGGSIESAQAAADASNVANNAVVLMADSNFQLSALGDVLIEAVTNSTALPQSLNNERAFGPSPQRSYFYTYGPSSAITVTSVGGDTTLNNNVNGLVSTARGLDIVRPPSLIETYPGTVTVAALSGDVGLPRAMQLFPSALGNLDLLAYGSVNIGSTLQMYETDPSLVANPLNPAAALSNLVLGASSLLPLTPLHQDDSQPIRVVALTGSIEGSSGAQVNSVVFPKAAEFVAGQNIDNINYAGKNLNPGDVTLFEAGGGITYQTSRDPTTEQLTTNSYGIDVGGPGYVEVLAGGGIDLGNSSGVTTTGNLTDVRLPASGASLVVGAGFGANPTGGMRDPAYDAFIKAYLVPGSSSAASTYDTQLVSYLASLYPATMSNLTVSKALAAFMALPRTQQLPFLSGVLSEELDATGLAHTLTGANYDRGYQAIATLFPTKNAQSSPLTYTGDINLYFSQLKTEEGGDINLLAPGGAVVVGVPNPPATLDALKQDTTFSPPLAADANLGILVLANGAVRGFASGDFDVNQSRILTLQGGDIILWSSYGNIDAGKGATTAQGAPPPVVQTDASGNVFVNPVGAVSGSGIGQLLTIPGLTPGSVDLIAPTGFVNAGDAGIRVAGNLNIAAVAVLNVGNIKVGGTATGVPVSDAGALSGALSGANSLGDAAKNAAEELSQNLGAAATYQQLTDALTPSFIVVRMFCLGVECNTE